MSVVAEGQKIQNWREEIQGKVTREDMEKLVSEGSVDHLLTDVEFDRALKSGSIYKKEEGAKPDPESQPAKKEEAVASDPYWKKLGFDSEETFLADHKKQQETITQLREKDLQHERAWKEKQGEWGQMKNDFLKKQSEQQAQIERLNTRANQAAPDNQTTPSFELPDFVPPEGNPIDDENYMKKFNDAFREHQKKNASVLKAANDKVVNLEKRFGEVASKLDKLNDLDTIKNTLEEQKQRSAQSREDKALEDLYTEMDRFADANKVGLTKPFKQINDIWNRTGGNVDGILSPAEVKSYKDLMGIIDIYLPSNGDGSSKQYNILGTRRFNDLEEAYLIYQKRNGKLAQAEVNANQAGQKAVQSALGAASAPSNVGAPDIHTQKSRDELLQEYIKACEEWDKVPEAMQHLEKYKPIKEGHNKALLELSKVDDRFSPLMAL